MSTLAFTKGHGTGNDFVLFADPDGERTLDAQALAVGLWELGGGEQAGAGLEVLVGVFRVQARLQRVAARHETLTQARQRRDPRGPLGATAGGGRSAR